MITRQTIKRLEREASVFDPEQNYSPYVTCEQNYATKLYTIKHEGSIKTYKTIEDLECGERLKPAQQLIILTNYKDAII